MIAEQATALPCPWDEPVADRVRPLAASALARLAFALFYGSVLVGCVVAPLAILLWLIRIGLG